MKLKKIISAVLTLSIVAIPIVKVSAAWSWPTTFDMDNKIYPLSSMANVANEGAYGYFTDPTDEDNTVLGIKVVNNSGADMRSMLTEPSGAYQYDFDIYREDAKGTFNLEIKPNLTGGYGSPPDNYFVWTGNNTFAFSKETGKGLCEVEPQTWYSFRFRINAAHDLCQVLYKKRGSKKYVSVATMELDPSIFSGHDVFFYCKNQSTNYTYLDNLHWEEIDDFAITQSYSKEFNDVKDKSGTYLTTSINTTFYKWSQAEFDGAQTLMAKTSDPSAYRMITFDWLPKIEDKLVASARFGIDSSVGLPYQVGVIPAFALEDGSVDATIRYNVLSGILFERDRVNLHGEILQKEDPESGELVNIVPESGRLYDVGYIYERSSKTLTAFFIDLDGTMYTKDVSDEVCSNSSAADLFELSPVQEGRYLGALQIYQQTYKGYLKCASYWDYIRVNEYVFPESIESTIFDGDEDVNLLPQISFTYNTILNKDEIGYASLEDNKGNVVPVDYYLDGISSIAVSPREELKPSTAYKLIIGGASDCFGNVAKELAVNFKTGSRILLSKPSIEDKIINYTLISNDDVSDGATVVAVAYNKDGGLISKTAYRYTGLLQDKTITDSITLETDDEFDLVELYLWDDIVNINPYVNPVQFKKIKPQIYDDESVLLNANYNRDTEVMTISGNAAPNSSVVIKMYKTDTDLSVLNEDSDDVSVFPYLKQIVTDDNGNYKVSFAKNVESGKYYVYAKDTQTLKEVTKQVSLYDIVEVTSVLEEIAKAKTIDDLAVIFDDVNADILGIDNSEFNALSSTQQKELLGYMLSDLGNVDVCSSVANLEALVARGELLYKLNNSASAAEFGKNFEAGFDYIDLDDEQSLNIYQNYYSDSRKSTLYGILQKQKYQTYADLGANFADQALLVAAYNQEQYNLIGKIFDESKVFSSLSTGKYNSLNESAKTSVLKTINNKKTPFSTLDELANAVKKYSDEANSSNSKPSSTGGGGGGGGGGGSFEQITTTKTDASNKSFNSEYARWMLSFFNVKDVDGLVNQLITIVK